ncbi:MAG: SpoIID/LytB domain-containing protein [Leptolyngbya sp. Prado105]|jgi:stage II sporulation protein D|nr:SpoIID/LytB domain-containing protein [Leptolyngbya sp. Prado105]
MVNQMNFRSSLSFLARPKIWGFALVLWAAALMPAQARDTVNLRVAIEKGVPQINVGSSTNAQVLDATEQTALGEIQGMNGFAAQVQDGQVALDKWRSGAITIMPKDNGVVWIGDRWYRGTVRLIASGGRLLVVNNVELEQYLLSVLGAEMNGNWPKEALKAQAVTARSYALEKRGDAIRAGQAYDVHDTQQSQVYKGLQTESQGTLQAVAETAGQVLVHNGELIEAYFHSSAGGCTEPSENVWSASRPYLQMVKNDFDKGTPVSEWSRTLSANELGNIFGVGTVQRVVPVRATPCGRIREMQIIGDRQSVKVSGERIQSALNLRSTLFDVTPQQVAASKSGGKPALQFVVNGRGFGHGVGMSQWGAYNMARRGKNYQDILMEYYKNVGITTIATDR